MNRIWQLYKGKPKQITSSLYKKRPGALPRPIETIVDIINQQALQQGIRGSGGQCVKQ